MRHLKGIDLGVESVPDAATLFRFRHLLEEHDLTRKIFEEVNALPSEKQLLMRKRTPAPRGDRLFVQKTSDRIAVDHRPGVGMSVCVSCVPKLLPPREDWHLQ